MDFNANKLPDDRLLPASITVTQEFRTETEVDGEMVSNAGTRTIAKKPIHVVQAVIADGAAEPSYRVLCTDASHEVIPLSAFGTVEKKEEA